MAEIGEEIKSGIIFHLFLQSREQKQNRRVKAERNKVVFQSPRKRSWLESRDKKSN